MPSVAMELKYSSLFALDPKTTKLFHWHGHGHGLLGKALGTPSNAPHSSLSIY